MLIFDVRFYSNNVNRKQLVHVFRYAPSSYGSMEVWRALNNLELLWAIDTGKP